MFMFNKNKWKLLIVLHSRRKQVIRHSWAAGNLWILHFTISLNIKRTMMSEKSTCNLRHSAHEETLLILQFLYPGMTSIPQIHAVLTYNDTSYCLCAIFITIQGEQKRHNPNLHWPVMQAQALLQAWLQAHRTEEDPEFRQSCFWVWLTCSRKLSMREVYAQSHDSDYAPKFSLNTDQSWASPTCDSSKAF